MIVVVIALVVLGTALLPLAQRLHDVTVWIVTIGFYVLAAALLLADLFLFRWSADHSRLLCELAADIRNNPPRGVKLDAAVARGLVRPGDKTTLVSMLTLRPLQYQVYKMDANDAMRVWRVATPAEKSLLQNQVLMKLANSKTLAPDLVAKYLLEVQAAAPVGN